MRPVVNLKPLIRFLARVHFKIEGVHVVRDLRKGDWMCRINLKGAYYAIPFCRKHQPLLCFIWGPDMFQFTCLPFGFASAPQCLPKFYNQYWGILHLSGVRCVIYLNDFLIIVGSRDKAASQCSTATQLLESLVFLVTYSKSQTLPMQEVTILGLNIDKRTKELQKLFQIWKQAKRLLELTWILASIVCGEALGKSM